MVAPPGDHVIAADPRHCCVVKLMSLRNRIPGPATSQMFDTAEQEPQTPEPYSLSATQNVLNVGASPQEVLQAQREAETKSSRMLLCIRLNSRLKDSLRTQGPNWTFFLRAPGAEANARGDQL